MRTEHQRLMHRVDWRQIICGGSDWNLVSGFIQWNSVSWMIEMAYFPVN